jgi:putative NADH-flavin reductase
MTGLVLLTGATGFVGRQVLRALADRGAVARIVVREGKQNELTGLKSIEKVIGTADLFAEGSAWWGDVCSGIDTVIHTAWHVEPATYLQSPKNLDCLAGTLQLAKGAAQAGVKRFLGIGTCFEYDLAAGTLSVHSPLRPYDSELEAKACPKGDIRLVEDQNSGLVYNADFSPELMNYDAHYQNEQAVSPLFQMHLESVVQIVDRCMGRESIAEIGCGKGVFLEMLSAKGSDVSGFDPAYEGRNPRVSKTYFAPGVTSVRLISEEIHLVRRR